MNNQTIRYVAKVIGLMTSSLPGVKHGAAHYKYLEQEKQMPLRYLKDDLMDDYDDLCPQSISDFSGGTTQ